jgi:hypothetical protein
MHSPCSLGESKAVDYTLYSLYSLYSALIYCTHTLYSGESEPLFDSDPVADMMVTAARAKEEEQERASAVAAGRERYLMTKGKRGPPSKVLIDCTVLLKALPPRY